MYNKVKIMDYSEHYEIKELKTQTVCNLSKWRGKRRPASYDRPGTEYKAEKKYRKNKTHTGKGITLRSHR